ncbi:MAG: hypothetical protein KGJ54_06410 [Betaproteobacteria bacterium]|nr:hypothetical protein [Betaproteobacteria bacterium]
MADRDLTTTEAIKPHRPNERALHKWSDIYVLREGVTHPNIQDNIDRCVLQLEGMTTVLSEALDFNRDILESFAWAIRDKASELRALMDVADNMRIQKESNHA